MAVIQDIHINDVTLKDQFVQYFKNEDYSDALEILSNSQLNGKKSVASVFNNINSSAYQLENHFFTGVINYLNTLQQNFDAKIVPFLGTVVQYSSETAYSVGNVVSYNNSVYLCIQNSLGHLPTDTNYWKSLGLRGDDGASSLTDVNIKFQWSASVQYTTKDLVYHNGASWVATQSNIGQEPSIGSAYWEQFIKTQKASLPILTEAPSNPTVDETWILINQ